MEIEIITIKRKLTKSLINQMKIAGYQEMVEFECVGYVKGLRFSGDILFILKKDTEYCIAIGRMKSYDSHSLYCPKTRAWVRFNNMSNKNFYTDMLERYLRDAPQIFY